MITKVVFIGLVWPEPETTAAGRRILQLVRFFLERSAEVHFASTASRTDHSFSLEDIGVQSHEIELNCSEFDHWIAKMAPDIVVFDRFVTEEQFSWRVRDNCPSALRVLDSEDLHFLRENRRLNLNEPNLGLRVPLYNDLTLRELGSVFRSDLTLVISEFEMNVLLQDYHVPSEILHYLPFLITEEDYNPTESLPPFSDRVDFMTIGNWKHGPNKDAIAYLKRAIWPQIRRHLPEANIHVYGAYGPVGGSGFHDPGSGFLVEGWTESIKEAFISHRVCLAPLRYGAGLKGKLFDALRFGTPSVTSSIGCEGMSDPKAWSGFVCDSPEEFARAAIKLCTEADVWQDAQAKGEKILTTRFPSEKFIPEFDLQISGLLENLEFHRLKNVTGALLWHHSAQSTKYMSKWIEAKNKNKNLQG